jgi:protease-4
MAEPPAIPPSPPPVYYSAPPPPPKGNGCLWTVVVLLVLALLGSMFINFILGAGRGMEAMTDIAQMEPMSTVRPKRRFHESMEQEGKSKSSDRIVRIDVEGVISSGSMGEGLFSAGMPMVEHLKRALEQAVNDSRVKAIVLRVNSPGGEVTASDIMYAAVKEAAQKKKVVVYMDSVAASGGYYLSCPASLIVASETTLTGSIGVIMESMSYHGLFDKIGMGSNTFTSGAFKDTLSGARPMRDDEKAYIQGLVNGMYDRFLTVVSEGRKIPKDALRNGVADGRVVTGREALAAKLVDRIGYIEDAYAAARELANSPNAMIVKYGSEPSFMDLFSMDAESRSKTKLEVQLPGASMLPKLLPGQMYYLPPAFAH